MWQGSSRRRCDRTEAERYWDEPTDLLTDCVPLEPTSLHALRLDTVCACLLASGARSVADLGCGDGSLVRRLLAHPAVHQVVGVDISATALRRLESDRADDIRAGRLQLIHGSFTDSHRELADVEAVAMVETIEHIPAARLSRLEHGLFGQYRPATVVITTPNQEYNVLFGMKPGRMREPGHRFEWPRARFRQWSAGVALRHGYVLELMGIGEEDPVLGCPTQAACFRRRDVNNEPVGF